MAAVTDIKAQLADLGRRRALLHRRSEALKAPGRDATEVEERTFVAALDRLEVESDELDQEEASLRLDMG